jgi:hypothetical protein
LDLSHGADLPVLYSVRRPLPSMNYFPILMFWASPSSRQPGLSVIQCVESSCTATGKRSTRTRTTTRGSSCALECCTMISTSTFGGPVCVDVHRIEIAQTRCTPTRTTSPFDSSLIFSTDFRNPPSGPRHPPNLQRCEETQSQSKTRRAATGRKSARCPTAGSELRLRGKRGAL